MLTDYLSRRSAACLMKHLSIPSRWFTFPRLQQINTWWCFKRGAPAIPAAVEFVFPRSNFTFSKNRSLTRSSYQFVSYILQNEHGHRTCACGVNVQGANTPWQEVYASTCYSLGAIFQWHVRQLSLKVFSAKTRQWKVSFGQKTEDSAMLPKAGDLLCSHHDRLCTQP